MRITSVESITVKVPAARPGGRDTWTIIVVRSDDGTAGIGRGGDVGIVSNVLAPLLVGEDPRMIAMLWDRMYEAVWGFGGPGRAGMPSIGAVDVALWDLYGKSCGEPVWRLLGGFRNTVPAYADGSGYADEEDQSADGIAQLVKKHADLGFEAIKVHMYRATRPEDVVERVHRCRELIGPDVRLMVDLHQAWDGKTAVDMAQRLEPYDLYWIEEPVRHDDEPANMRMVQQATSAMVAGGEGQGTLYGIRRLLAEGALQLVQTDILNGGGYTGLLRIAALAEAFHVPISPHGAQFPDVNSHLVAAVPNGLIVSTYPSSEPHEIWSKMYDPPFLVNDGQIILSDRPGLGHELDWGFIELHRVSAE